MLQRFLLLGVSVFLLSCQTSPNIQRLEMEKAEVEAELESARQQISSLESERRILAGDNAELKRVMAILDTEKSSRTQESTQLRMQVRKFTQAQIDNLKEFLVQSDLLDYIGEEIFDRTKMGAEPGVLVDFANPIPRNGSLIGVNGYFAQPTHFFVNVLRPLNDRYVVIWQSQVVEVNKLGYQRVRFPVSVGVEKGDVIAYDFPVSIGVKYDQGTGNTLMSKRSYPLGASIEAGSLKGEEERRAYSLGVIAILE